MNKVILIGRLTKDIEITTTSSGISVARFAIAVNRRFMNADGEREVDFINIVAWRGLAENCSKYLSKGSQAAIVGSIQTRSYEAEDGTKKYMTEVIANEVEFIGTKKQSGEQVEKTDKTDKADLTPVDDDSLPF